MGVGACVVAFAMPMRRIWRQIRCRRRPNGRGNLPTAHPMHQSKPLSVDRLGGRCRINSDSTSPQRVGSDHQHVGRTRAGTGIFVDEFAPNPGSKVQGRRLFTSVSARTPDRRKSGKYRRAVIYRLREQRMCGSSRGSCRTQSAGMKDGFNGRGDDRRDGPVEFSEQRLRKWGILNA